MNGSMRVKKTYSGTCETHGDWQGNDEPCCPNSRCEMDYLQGEIDKRVGVSTTTAFILVVSAGALLAVICYGLLMVAS